MYKNIISILLTLISYNLYSQIDCNPYNHRVKNYIVEEKNNYGISYVSCFHAQGVVVDLSYRSVMVGTHMMNKGHKNSVYGFISYKVHLNDRTILHGGPLYRINNDSGFLMGQYGMDYKLYKGFNLTSRVLHVNPLLNYLNVGVKLTI